MKLFNRGNDAPKAATPASPALVAPAAAPTPAGPAAAMAAPAPAPLAAAPPAPELTAILDANVKDMSEKIARLASTVESQTNEKGALEQKLEQMEERMRKLSSLTEMISAQYNPFVGDAPQERDPLPQPEVGLAPPPPAALGLPSIAPPLAMVPATPPPPPFPSSLDALLEVPLPPGPSSLDAPTFEMPAATAPFAAPPASNAAPEGAPPAALPWAPTPVAENPHGVSLWNAPTSFEGSLLMLSWADMLMRQASSRESLASLVNYYHNIGWIGDPARDSLLAYADGLAPHAPDDSSDWRASLDVHEQSLLFVEKLRMVSARRSP